jgi:ubiquinone/menaquinone biosynthesis C-methylase UbiE
MKVLHRIRSSIKMFFELCYWRLKKIKEGQLTNYHYKYFYTSYFSLPDEFYKDKIIMDIGCGPRGSLEWATMTQRRIGLDPLANQYLKLGADKHSMEYVNAFSENMPFPDNYFDVITSFNSLDHVDNVELTCNEIKRTLKENGILLLIVEIHHKPQLTEPQTLGWDCIGRYFPGFYVVEEKHLKEVQKHFIYRNLRSNIPLIDKTQDGVLTAMIRK